MKWTGNKATEQWHYTCSYICIVTVIQTRINVQVRSAEVKPSGSATAAAAACT